LAWPTLPSRPTDELVWISDAFTGPPICFDLSRQ
jgi:hypothetical protein